jgi:hypothetical protein
MAEQGIGIATTPSIALQFLIFEIISMVEVLFDGDEHLMWVVDEGVTRKWLSTVYMDGCWGEAMHLRLVVLIQYDELQPNFTVRQETGPFGPASSPRNPFSDPPSVEKDAQQQFQHCRMWGRIVNSYADAIQRHGLELRWAVDFTEHEEERARYFNLERITREDHTSHSSDAMPNTQAKGAYVWGRWSEQVR